MHHFKLAVLTSLTGMLLICSGCQRKEASADSKNLEKSFETARPEVKQAVNDTVLAIKAATATQDISAQKTHYIEALQPMQKLVTQGNLSKEQIQAVVKQFNEMNKSINAAIQRDPRLAASKELHQARSSVAQALFNAGVR